MTSFRVNTTPCPIEFPPTCEVRVNNVQLTANLKGLKKKPGTAPPADLGKAVRISSIQNRVEMVYVNSQQPVQHKVCRGISVAVRLDADNMFRRNSTSSLCLSK